MKIQFKKGFSLLELVLVLGVGATVGFIKFQDMKTEQENILASTVGQQMKQMGRHRERVFFASFRNGKTSVSILTH